MACPLLSRCQVLLDRFKEELEENYGVEARTIRADPDSISKIEPLTSDLEIGLVVPNAGIELSGAFIESSLAANYQTRSEKTRSWNR